MSLKHILKGLIKKLSCEISPSPTVEDVSIPIERKIQSSGIATQFAGIDPSAPHKQLVIGLDFGTAFTKVVVGEDRLKIAVPLRGRGEKSSDYLLPSVYWSTREGKCLLDPPLDKTAELRQHMDLKMPLITGDFRESDIQRTAAYLALVLRRVRAFIFDNKKGLYGSHYIDWFVNVGLPTRSYHDEKLEGLYKRMIATAWFSSASDGDVCEHSTEEAWQKSSIEENFEASECHLHHEAISVFPEFVAQVTGYVRSPSRQPDLHLLVDVGAGTLDATVFNVHEVDGEDKFPIFAEAVEPLGTRFLIRSRIKGQALKEEGKLSPFAPVPNETEFASLLGVDVTTLREKDTTFKKRVIEVVGSRLQQTKSYRYRESQRWKEGVPVFLCGGGASCDFYTEIFSSKKSNFPGVPLKEVELPKPDQLEASGLREEDYDRLSVAYGLSFDPLDIGEIMKEGELEYDTSPATDNSYGSGAVCSKCNGTGGLHTTCSACGGSGFIGGDPRG